MTNDDGIPANDYTLPKGKRIADATEKDLREARDYYRNLVEKSLKQGNSEKAEEYKAEQAKMQQALIKKKGI